MKNQKKIYTFEPFKIPCLMLPNKNEMPKKREGLFQLKTIKYLSLIFCNILFYLSVNAQQDLGLHFLPNTLQASRTNPALLPADRLIVGLPNVYFNIRHTSGSLNDILEFDDNDGPTKVKINSWIDQLNSENLFQGNSEIETLHLFYRLGKLSFSLNHVSKFDARFNYPDTYIKLIGNGNAQFAGETVEFGPDLQINAYQEFGLGIAYDISDKITVAGKVKVLQGLGNVSTLNSQASIFTDDDIYQITVKSQYDVNGTNFISLDENRSFDLDFSSYEIEDLFTDNSGLGFDFGIVVKPIEQLTIAASIIDIGQIDWKENATNYKTNIDKTYEGVVIDFPALLKGEEADFSNIDTINFENLFNFQNEATSYSTKLPRKIYLSATYQLKKLTIGALYHSESFRSKRQNAFAVNATAKISKLLTLGATYTNRFDRDHQVGVNTTLKLGPVQLFATTDNIISLFQPLDAEQADARIGLNIVLGQLFNKNTSEE